MSSLIISLAFNLILAIALLIFVLMLLMIKKHTPALAMYKAKMKGIPLCFFFNDDKTFEMQPIKADNGIINHPKLGAFVINEQGSYIDRGSKFVVLSFSSSLGVSIPAKFAKITDSLKKWIGDEEKLNRLRIQLMDGSFEKTTRDIFANYAKKKILKKENLSDDEKKKLIREIPEARISRFDVIRESIDYSSVKSMMNSITPQNVNNKINATIARRFSEFMGDGMKYMVILLLAGILIVGSLGFILYMFNNPSPEKLAMAKAMASAATRAAVPVVTNASILG